MWEKFLRVGVYSGVYSGVRVRGNVRGGLEGEGFFRRSFCFWEWFGNVWHCFWLFEEGFVGWGRGYSGLGGKFWSVVAMK